MITLKLAAAFGFALLLFQEPPKVADQVLHLRFDDGKAEDGSGSATAVKVVGKVEWAEGKLAGALKLDGAGGHVEVASSETLDKLQAESYTIALWFKPEAVPPGTESDNHARYGLVIKEGWHCGLSYNSEKQFVMEHWLGPAAGGDEPVWAGAGTWEESCDAGKWYHVAGVVDRKAGLTKLYLNGELKNSAEWEAGKAARDYGKSPWRIGIANPGAQKWSWPAKGLLDDVQIFKKALDDAAIAAIYKGAAK